MSGTTPYSYQFRVPRGNGTPSAPEPYVISAPGYATQTSQNYSEGNATVTRNWALTPLTSVSCVSIVEVKAVAENTPIDLSELAYATVSSTTFTDGSFYVEAFDRTAGIKVVPRAPSVVTKGQEVVFSGYLETDTNGEKFVDATYVLAYDQWDNPPKVVGALGVGGKGFSIVPSVTGLLITTWGKVTSRTFNYAVIDDGSGSTVRVALSGLTSPITKVVLPGNYVSVIGLAGLVRPGATSLQVIRPRGDDDITVF